MDNRLLENSMADFGIEYINDTEAHPGVFVGLMVTSDIVIDTIIAENNTGNELNGETLPAGSYAFRFKSLKLTSGKAIAVRGA